MHCVYNPLGCPTHGAQNDKHFDYGIQINRTSNSFNEADTKALFSKIC